MNTHSVQMYTRAHNFWAEILPRVWKASLESLFTGRLYTVNHCVGRQRVSCWNTEAWLVDPEQRADKQSEGCSSVWYLLPQRWAQGWRSTPACDGGLPARGGWVFKQRKQCNPKLQHFIRLGRLVSVTHLYIPTSWHLQNHGVPLPLPRLHRQIDRATSMSSMGPDTLCFGILHTQSQK